MGHSRRVSTCLQGLSVDGIHRRKNTIVLTAAAMNTKIKSATIVFTAPFFRVRYVKKAFFMFFFL